MDSRGIAALLMLLLIVMFIDVDVFKIIADSLGDAFKPAMEVPGKLPDTRYRDPLASQIYDNDMRVANTLKNLLTTPKGLVTLFMISVLLGIVYQVLSRG